ncbi:hypothetical protein ACIO3O_12000 [Streptomyces sp. NPDC087440]|uniref:hypothetical protein n=1 Tax=Streptomyces sp. NPDC087440 TaxID=3365790 RepID=UPI0038246BDC
MRKKAQLAAVTLAGGMLALTMSTSAHAAGGPTNLTGKGCPSSYDNNSGGVRWIQTLKSKTQSSTQRWYGLYKVVYLKPNTQEPVSQPNREYACW